MRAAARFFCVLCAAAFLASGCESTRAVKPVPPPPHTRGDIESRALVLALRAADRIQDALGRISLYSRIIEIATNAGLTDDAAVLLTYVSEVLEASGSEEWFEEFSTALSRRYLALGMVRPAAERLQEKLPRIARMENDMRKLLLLEEVIDICLAGGESFLPLLRQTIDTVLVLDDTGMKTELLVKSAARFFSRNLVKDTQDLLQLTLSQIGGLESPWDQAEIYSRVALVYQGLKNERRTKEYADRAASEIDAMQVIIRTQEEAAKVGLTAENLLRLTTPETALRVASTIEYPWILAETFCRMALAGKDDRLLDRAYETAASISNNARRLSTLFQLDFLMAEAKRFQEVADNLALRDAEIATIPALAVDSYTSRLARLYLAVGGTADAVKTAERIRDAYSRSSILLSAARLHIEAGQPENAAPLLAESYALSRNAGQTRGRILQDISGVYLASGDTRNAARTAADISEPFSFAAALTDFVRYLLENKIETGDAENELRVLETVLENGAA